MSVVVPTRDRSPSLARSLAALQRQVGSLPLEIVVVDDGSKDAEAVKAVVDACPHARLLRTTPAGPAAARNAGVRAANGEIVCFTDDDCEPEPEWAERLRGALAEGADAVGGSTVSGRRGDSFSDATNVITNHLQRPHEREQRIVFTPSNNLASRRELLLELPFDESYPSASGEDRDWCARLLTAGGRIVLVPEAVVRHVPSTGLGNYWRQHVRYGRGAYRLARRRDPGPRLEPPSFYLRLVRRGFSRGIRCGLLIVLAQLATAVGFLREAHSLRTPRRR